MTPTTFVWGAGDMSTVQPTMEKSEGTSLSNEQVYPVLVRRTIGDQPYDCKTNAGSTDESRP